MVVAEMLVGVDWVGEIVTEILVGILEKRDR